MIQIYFQANLLNKRVFLTHISINKGQKCASLKYTFFKRFYLFIFRERGREGEREGEKHWPATWGMLPDQESNLQPLGLQAGTQSTEPHQPGQNTNF